MKDLLSNSILPSPNPACLSAPNSSRQLSISLDVIGLIRQQEVGTNSAV